MSDEVRKDGEKKVNIKRMNKTKGGEWVRKLKMEGRCNKEGGKESVYELKRGERVQV